MREIAPAVKEHRDVLRTTLDVTARLFRDVSIVQTPWGAVSSNAIYRRDSDNHWHLVVDEFGEPTDIGRRMYARFARPAQPDRIIRIANRNQLLLADRGITQLTPLSWTKRFVELSSLYDLLRQFPSTYWRQLDNNDVTRLAALVELAVGPAEKTRALRDIEAITHKADGLPADLQALLLVCDSDLGKPSEPFLQLDGFDPASLNRLSRWRCWSNATVEDELTALLVPPAALQGQDIYRRPVWGTTPVARLRHLCVEEISFANISPANAYVVDYARLWNLLRTTLTEARDDRHVQCRVPAGVVRDELIASRLRRIEFWLKFWSHHMREVLVFGELQPDQIFELEMVGTGSLATFRRGPIPIWCAGRAITQAELLRHWGMPFCPADDRGRWHESLVTQ